LTEFVDHSVNDILQLDHNDTLDVHGDLLGQVATGDGITHAGDILNLSL
jgi:hypothetical protein